MSDLEAVTTTEAPATGGVRRHVADRSRSLAADAWHDLLRNKIFWVANAYVYVSPAWGNAAGYLTAAQWNNLPQVGADQFSNVLPATGTYDATLNGVLAGSRL